MIVCGQRAPGVMRSALLGSVSTPLAPHSGRRILIAPEHPRSRMPNRKIGALHGQSSPFRSLRRPRRPVRRRRRDPGGRRPARSSSRYVPPGSTRARRRSARCARRELPGDVSLRRGQRSGRGRQRASGRGRRSSRSATRYSAGRGAARATPSTSRSRSRQLIAQAGRAELGGRGFALRRGLHGYAACAPSAQRRATRWPSRPRPAGSAPSSCSSCGRAGATVLGIASEAITTGSRAHGVVPVAYGEGLLERLRRPRRTASTPSSTSSDPSTSSLPSTSGSHPSASRPSSRARRPRELGSQSRGQQRLPPRPKCCRIWRSSWRPGQIEIPIAATYPLEQVRDAFAATRGAAHARQDRPDPLRRTTIRPDC